MSIEVLQLKPSSMQRHHWIVLYEPAKDVTTLDAEEYNIALSLKEKSMRNLWETQDVLMNYI